MRNLKIGFIGLGLIGGSLAKAIRKFHPETMILAFDQNRTSLEQALHDGTVNEINTEPGQSFSDCDYIFLCAPVQFNTAYLHILKNIIGPDTIITDVSSTKTNVHQTVSSLGMDKVFIGGHPMAGSEKSGYENAAALILENAYYAITPTPSSPAGRVEELKELAASIGALPILLNYEEHDYAVAAISHVPHLIAASLVNLVKDSDSREGTMKLLAAGGFKDITRIASSSPVMWQQVCATNRENIAKLLGDYIDNLNTVKTAVETENGQAIYDMFEKSRDYRNSFADKSSGLIGKINAIYCDIFDETGAIATIATLLAENAISMRNIGIVHNREHEEGVLRIEFHEEASSIAAASLLEKLGYTIYKRT